MSRAFMKERDDLPDSPMLLQREPEPAATTADGLARLRKQYDETSDPSERARLERVLETLRVIAPPDDRSRVAFSATVTIADTAGVEQRFSIVGEDDIDIVSGRIGIESPLARALIGARAGDTVTWTRPAGDQVVHIVSIDYE